MFDKRLRIFIEVLREVDFALQNVLVDSHWVIIVERVNTSIHLINQDP